MRIRGLMLVLSLAALSATVLAAPAQDADKLFAKGQALLARADFEGALQAFKEAVKADPTNKEYRMQAALLKRAMTLRDKLDEEPDAAKWQAKARGLYAFYMQHGVYGEAVALAGRMFERSRDADNAVFLARAQLVAGETQAAVETLDALPEAERTPEVQALLALALARSGQADQAANVLEDIEVPAKAGWTLLYDLACAHGRLGHRDQALGYLVRCFENTPPGRLESLKQEVRTGEDFAELADTPGFAKAMSTASKVTGGCCAGKAGGCGKSCGSAGKSSCASQQKAGCAADAKTRAACPGHADQDKPHCDHDKQDQP